MKRLLLGTMAVLTMGLFWEPVWAQGCPADMVKVGSVCVDKYEASVWENPDGTGTQYGATADDYPCADTGNDCKDKMYAVSRAGETPSASITWFQAQQACGNVGKRLLSNAEWQAAAAGTPDPGGNPGEEECNTNSGEPVSTGSRANCVSVWEVFDMVGNVAEWVEDWVPRSALCLESKLFDGTDDDNCLAGAATDTGPGVLHRGGHFGLFGKGGRPGVFTVHGGNEPSDAFDVLGFRCAR